MKRILLFSLLYISSLAVFSQPGKLPSALTGTLNRTTQDRGSYAVDGYLFMGNVDTTYTPYRSGAMTRRPQDGKVYIWDSLGVSSKKWVVIDKGPAANWLLTGNAGTTAGTNFIGTTDSTDFVTKINNIERLRYKANGKNITITSANTSNLFDSASLFVNAPLLTAGHGLSVKAPSLTSGAMIDLLAEGTGASGTGLTGQRGIQINLKGINAIPTASSFALHIQNQHTGTTANNWGIYSESSGGFYNTAGHFVASNSGSYGTNAAVYGTATGGAFNYSGVFDQGDFGIGTIAPLKKLHLVGTMRLESLGTSTYDTTTYKPAVINSSGDVIPMAYWPKTTTSIPISSLTAATGSNVIDNQNNLQQWTWSSLSGTNGLSLVSSSTAAASNQQKLFNVAVSGVNSNSNQTTYGGYFSNLHQGTGATNIAGYFTASQGATNYALITDGQIRSTNLGAASSDTTTNKPLGINSSGDVVPMTNWPLSSGTVGSFAFTDGNGFDGTVTNSTTNPTLSLTTQLTQGSIPFIGSGGSLSQSNANLFWNPSIGAAGALGVGTNSLSSWSSDQSVIQLGATASFIAEKTATVGSGFGFSNNAYFDGSVWKYMMGDAASNYYQANGVHNYRVAASGSTGGTISWINAMKIDATGNVGIGTTTPTYPLNVSGMSAYAAGFKNASNNRTLVIGGGLNTGDEAGIYNTSDGLIAAYDYTDGKYYYGGGYNTVDGAGNSYFGANVAIGGAGAGAASAVLTLESTSQGFLPPRMTTTERNAITSPAEGLVIYNLTTHKLNVRGALAWEEITSF